MGQQIGSGHHGSDNSSTTTFRMSNPDSEDLVSFSMTHHEMFIEVLDLVLICCNSTSIVENYFTEFGGNGIDEEHVGCC